MSIDQSPGLLSAGTRLVDSKCPVAEQKPAAQTICSILCFHASSRKTLSVTVSHRKRRPAWIDKNALGRSLKRFHAGSAAPRNRVTVLGGPHGLSLRTRRSWRRQRQSQE